MQIELDLVWEDSLVRLNKVKFRSEILKYTSGVKA